MRNDGVAAFYLVQHDAHGDGRWVETALDEVLFAGRSRLWKQSPVADEIRDLMAEQGASSDLWQRYGVNGFSQLESARKICALCRGHLPKYGFRVVMRVIAQHTVVIEEGSTGPHLADLNQAEQAWTRD